MLRKGHTGTPTVRERVVHIDPRIVSYAVGHATHHVDQTVEYSCADRVTRHRHCTFRSPRIGSGVKLKDGVGLRPTPIGTTEKIKLGPNGCACPRTPGRRQRRESHPLIKNNIVHLRIIQSRVCFGVISAERVDFAIHFRSYEGKFCNGHCAAGCPSVRHGIINRDGAQ